MVRAVRRAAALLLLVGSTVLMASPSGAGSLPDCGKSAPVSPMPSSVGRFHGIVPLHAPTSGTCALRATALGSPMAAAPASGPLYEGGSPPLRRLAGNTMGTATTPGEATLTPIYWSPEDHPYPGVVAQRLTAFAQNLAAMSGTARTSFGALTQYTNASGQRLHFLVNAGAPLLDTAALPRSGCVRDTGSIYADSSGYVACLTDSQLVVELHRLTDSLGLPVDRSHLYALFLPKGVELCFDSANGANGGSCTANSSVSSSGFCAYHSNDRRPSDPSDLLYAAQPYPIWDSPTGLSCNASDDFPSGVPAADVLINSYAHEVAEAITDPVGDSWQDSQQNEIGDLCAYAPMPLQGTPGARWSQTFNGVHYLLQPEFSNASFDLDARGGCISRWTLPSASLSISGTLRAGSTLRTSSGSQPGSGRIVISSWLLDGQRVASGSTASIALPAAGTHLLQLRVTDLGGYQAVASRQLVVSP